MLLSMAAAAFPERVALGPNDSGRDFADLERDATVIATVLRERSPGSVAYLGNNSPALPALLFAGAAAGVPVAPLNYRLPTDVLAELVASLDAPVIAVGPGYGGVAAALAAATGAEVLSADELLRKAAEADPVDERWLDTADDRPAVLLFTSGTTAKPKCVVLRHANLLSYILSTVEFGSADDAECALVSVPPYHIAGVASALSNVFAARRVIYLPDFSPGDWLELVRSERISSAMVVPTMLARIVDYLDGEPAYCPSLRSLAYGGSRMPVHVLEKALRAFPTTGFVNAYGLTETSSTIAVLSPDDHRSALESDDGAVRARLGSAGLPVAGIELQIRGEDGTVLAPGKTGELFVRGGQVSGEYRGSGSALDPDGWFATRDVGYIDVDGYLFLGGRSDDTIIRGGENIAPAEVEDALLAHPAVSEAAVVGLPDTEWGQRLVAAVVSKAGMKADAAELRAHVRGRLRTSRTPDEVVFVTELPYTPTGKLVRGQLVALLMER
jgi:acyl-CoA synthetase (AMP-forming)/AMP-acid ligase II